MLDNREFPEVSLPHTSLSKATAIIPAGAD